MTESIRVVLYARVSKDEKSDDERYQNPENQLSPLREFAKSQGWNIVKEYVDQKSGASPNRPMFRELREDAVKNQFDGILIWKLDRFSREGISNTLAYISQLKKLNIWIKSLTEGWVDTQNEGISELVLSIMAWAAAEERRKISERTKAGIAEKRKSGEWKGGRPKCCVKCGWSHKEGNPCKEPIRTKTTTKPVDKDFISEVNV
jgi:DNA invertase Pin-like site-specific DNA recombinase